MRNVLRNNPGDPHAGAAVFKNLCAQCHKIYGEGQEVGPDITLNGRASFEQLLSNVLDPSLVIGEAYQATTVATTDGRVLTGLRVEDTPQRVVLKIQGGKVETIPRGRDRGDEGQPALADARGPREAAQAAGDRRPVRLPRPRQAPDRPVGPPHPRDARRTRQTRTVSSIRSRLVIEREADLAFEDPIKEVADRPRREQEARCADAGRDVEDEVGRA